MADAVKTRRRCKVCEIVYTVAELSNVAPRSKMVFAGGLGWLFTIGSRGRLLGNRKPGARIPCRHSGIYGAGRLFVSYSLTSVWVFWCIRWLARILPYSSVTTRSAQ